MVGVWYHHRTNHTTISILQLQGTGQMVGEQTPTALNSFYERRRSRDSFFPLFDNPSNTSQTSTSLLLSTIKALAKQSNHQKEPLTTLFWRLTS